MRLLIISHAFAPGRNPRAFRWAALAQNWAALGHDVHVVTAALPGLAKSENAHGVIVHRVGGNWIEAIRGRFQRGVPAKAGSHKADDTQLSSQKSTITGLILKRVHDLTWKKLYWPDYAGLWIRPAIRECTRLLEGHPDTIVISVSIPFSSHLVGYFLRRRKLGKRWMMDIGDPFAFMVESPTNNHALYGRLNFAVERRVLASADAISVTTAGTLERYVNTFPVVAEKILEIPPLVSLPPERSAGIETRVGPRRLVYAGTLHKTIRGPERLLALFAQLLARGGEDLELHLYGNHHEVAAAFASLERRVRKQIHLHGEVDRNTALEAMRSAAALVNIGNDTTYQLPSKLVEYASMRKPVINVVATVNDSSIAFFDRHPCVVTVVGEDTLSVAAADRVLQFLSASFDSDCGVDPAWLNRFSMASVSGSYEQVLRRLAATDGKSLREVTA